MTPEERITELCDHIKREFPYGCREAHCTGCPLYRAKEGTTDMDICKALERLIP